MNIYAPKSENANATNSRVYPTPETLTKSEPLAISDHASKARQGNEPALKKIKLSENCAGKWNGLDDRANNDQTSVSQSSNSDEKVTSETLVLISSSNVCKTQIPANEDDTSTTRPLSLVEPKITSSNSSYNLPALCPCEAATRLDNIEPEENANDEASLSYFICHLTGAMKQLLGEHRLAQLGYPAISGQEVLEKVLRLTGTTVTREDDRCTETCKVMAKCISLFFCIKVIL